MFITQLQKGLSTREKKKDKKKDKKTREKENKRTIAATLSIWKGCLEEGPGVLNF